MRCKAEQYARTGGTKGTSRFRQRGLSLVELLVGLAVGLFLVAGIIQLLVSSRVSYTAEENFSRLQENARYAVNVIAREARMARTMGCRSLNMEQWYGDLNVVACAMLTNPADCGADPRPGPVTTSVTPLGYDNSEQTGDTWLVDLPESATAGGEGVDDRWVRGDVLVAWGVTSPGVVMTNVLDADARVDPIEIEAVSGDLKGGYLALVTNCAASDLFEISNAAGDDDTEALKHEAGVNATASMSQAYNNPVSDDKQTVGTAMKAMVYPFDYRVFFICEDNQTSRDGLCRWSANSGIDTLVNDVVDMRITYSGGDLNNQRADQVADWAGVDSAQVELLVASGEDVRTQAASPSNAAWPGGDDDRLGAGLPPDRHRYERFAFTVAFRATAPWFFLP